MPYTIQQFAGLIRQKYPQSDPNDAKVVRDFVAKWPVYKDQLDAASLYELDKPSRIALNVAEAGPFRGAAPKLPTPGEIYADQATGRDLLKGAEVLYPEASSLAQPNAQLPLRYSSGLTLDAAQTPAMQARQRAAGYVGPGAIPRPASNLPGIPSQLEQQQAQGEAAKAEQYLQTAQKYIPDVGGPLSGVKTLLNLAPKVSGAFKGAAHAVTGFAPEVDPALMPSEQKAYGVGAGAVLVPGMLASGYAASSPEPVSKAVGASIPAAYQALSNFNQQRREVAGGQRPTFSGPEIAKEAVQGAALGASMAVPLPARLTGPSAVLGQGLVGAGLNAIPAAVEQLAQKGKVDINDPEFQKWLAIGAGAGAGIGGIQALKGAKVRLPSAPMIPQSLKDMLLLEGRLGNESGHISFPMIRGAMYAGAGATTGAAAAKANDKDMLTGAAIGAVAAPALRYGIPKLIYGQGVPHGPVFDQMPKVIQDSLLPSAGQIEKLTPKGALTHAANTLKSIIKTNFTTEGKLKAGGFHDVHDDIIILKNKRLEVGPHVYDDLSKTLAPVTDDGEMLDGWTVINLRHKKDLADQLKVLEAPIPGGDPLDPEVARAALAHAEEAAAELDPNALTFANNARQWAKELGEIRVAGGRLTSEIMDQYPNYFPDVVVAHYKPDRPLMGAANPVGKFRKSGHEMKHKGGTRETIRDYVTVMTKYAAETYENQVRDNFVKGVVERHGKLGSLKDQIGELLDDPALLTPPSGETEISYISKLARKHGIFPDDHVIFDYHNTHEIIPKIIADRMKAHLGVPGKGERFINRLNAASKGIILRGIWGSFTLNNFLGDNLRLLGFDDSWNGFKVLTQAYGGTKTGAVLGGIAGGLTGAAAADAQGNPGWKGFIGGSALGAVEGALFGRLVGGPNVSASKAQHLYNLVQRGRVTPEALNPMDRALYYTAAVAKEANIGAGAATGELGQRIRSDPKIRHIQGGLTGIGKAVFGAGNYAVGKMDAIREYLETVPRLTEFMLNMERGNAPRTASRITRKIMIDYADLSPTEERLFRGFLIPFYTFYARNLQSLIPGIATGADDSLKTGARLAGRAWVRYLAPSLALTAYNNIVTPDVEDHLTENERNQPHVNIPWGVGDTDFAYIGFLDPFSAALRMGGAAGVIDRGLRLAQGKTTLGREVDASQNQAWQSTVGMLTPLISLPGSLISGTDWRTGQDIRNPARTGPENLGATAWYAAKTAPGAFVVARAAEEGEGPAETAKNIAQRFMLGGLYRGKNIEEMEQAARHRAVGLGMAEQTKTTQQAKREGMKDVARELLKMTPEDAEKYVSQKWIEAEIKRVNKEGTVALQLKSQLLTALTMAAEANARFLKLRNQISDAITTPQSPKSSRLQYIQRERNRFTQFERDEPKPK